MKANELRLDNLLEAPNGQYERVEGVYSIQERMEVTTENFIGLVSDFKPIPLTYEWLESVKGDSSFRLKFIKSIAAFEVERKYTSMHGEEWIFISNCRYRHEWQNLHFALTAEELTIKE